MCLLPQFKPPFIQMVAPGSQQLLILLCSDELFLDNPLHVFLTTSATDTSKADKRMVITNSSCWIDTKQSDEELA